MKIYNQGPLPKILIVQPIGLIGFFAVFIPLPPPLPPPHPLTVTELEDAMRRLWAQLEDNR